MQSNYRFGGLATFSLVFCTTLVGYGWLRAVPFPQSENANGVSNDALAIQASTAPKEHTQAKTDTVVWESDKNAKPAWLTRDSENDLSSKTEQAIRERLHQRLDFEFTATPLAAVMKFLSKELKIPIMIDDKSLNDEGITLDEPVTLQLENAKAINVLDLILQPLQLCVEIKNEVMLVTSQRTHASVIRYYDLSYILPDNSLCHEVLRLIESTVDPDNWVSAGGVARISIFGSMLVVSTTESNQLAIQELLRNVASQSQKNMKPLAAQKNSIPQLGPCPCCGNAKAPGHGPGGMM
jgi:hypothetical protein